MLVVYAVVLLKFLLPIAMLVYPFQASWANFVLDSIDGDILMHFGLEGYTYQSVDKLADYFTYIMMLIVGMRWKIKNKIVLLFLYRTIGQFLFFTTRNDFMFIFFPNFLEPLFMIYSLLLFKASSEAKAFSIYSRRKWLIWVIIITFKMWNEYNIHVIQNDLSQQFFGFNN